VEKAHPVQVRFTLCLRDQWSMWMQDGCKVYMDSYMASNEPCFMVTWIIFKNHLLKVIGLRQNQETNNFKRSHMLIYSILSCMKPTWIEIHWNRIWLRAQSHMTSQYHLRIRDHTTWFWRCLETAFGHFLLGSHSFMVTALGSSCEVAFNLRMKPKTEALNFRSLRLQWKPIYSGRSLQNVLFIH
jgi:hypothetical protein